MERLKANTNFEGLLVLLRQLSYLEGYQLARHLRRRNDEVESISLLPVEIETLILRFYEEKKESRDS